MQPQIAPAMSAAPEMLRITDFELPGQDSLLHTGYHLIHDLNASHELFRTGNIGFADIVLLRNLLTDAVFRSSGRNCVILTQFLRGRFLRSYCILPSGALSALHGAVLQRLRSNLFGISMRIYGASTNLILPSVFSISGSGKLFAKVVLPQNGTP